MARPEDANAGREVKKMDYFVVGSLRRWHYPGESAERSECRLPASSYTVGISHCAKLLPMRRRSAIGVLLSGLAHADIGRFFDGKPGAAVLMGVADGRTVAAFGSATPLPPGSTIKPLVLAALLRARKISPLDEFLCPGSLSIGRHSLACTHPPSAAPLRIPTALAYSCNAFTAHFAQRFEPGELSMALGRFGLPATLAHTRDAIRLQALGEEGISVTAAGLAAAYRGLALSVPRPEFAPIVEGLEGAVEFGTAQLARVNGMRIAGKTGSLVAGNGARMAWFAGFAPSRAPEVAVAVLLQGRSGGSDAAPIASSILEAYRAGRL